MQKQGFGHTGKRDLPEGELKYQIRINLSEEFASVARENPASPVLFQLLQVLREHDAHLKHQKMALANFLPYFKNEELAEHVKNVDEALLKMADAGEHDGGEDVAAAFDAAMAADDTDDVDATLEAMQALRDATNAFIERHADNPEIEGYKEAVEHFFDRCCRLYLWTKETVQKQMVKGENGFYSTRFSIYADGGQEVYSKDVADQLEADLQPLKEAGMIKVIQRFDSDPKNNPQAPEKFHI